MKKRLATILLSILTVFSSFGTFTVNANNIQKEYATGALWKAPSDYRTDCNFNFIDCSKPENQPNSKSSLPSSFDITTNASTAQFFPPIGDQGAMQSCTGWATTYYQFTYELNKFKNEPTTSTNILSPAWTFNYCNGGTNSPTYLDDAYAILHSQGALKLVDYPHSTSVSNYSFAWSTDITKMIEALNYRANSTDVCEVYFSSDISAIKSRLARGKTAVVFTNEDGWDIKTTNSQEKIIVRGSNRGNGGHAMTVVGYDDNIQVTFNGVTLTGAFKLANSWGADWGNDGYIWVAYDALNLASSYGTNWQSDFTGTRTRIFSWDTENPNVFNFMSVIKRDVYYVGYVNFISNNPWDLSLYANPGSTANIYQWDCTLEGQQGNNTSKCLVFDYFYAGITYNLNNYLSSDWTMRLTGSTNNNAYRISSQIIDNLEKPIAPINTVYGVLTNGSYTKTTNIKLAKGRVTSYDNNEITSYDSQMVTDYIIHNVEFSNLQKFLADYNSNGIVDITDVVAMNNHIASQNGKSYSITDYIDEWDCSLADIIEKEYNTPIEQYILKNYSELNSLNAIPDDLRSDIYEE